MDFRPTLRERTRCTTLPVLQSATMRSILPYICPWLKEGRDCLQRRLLDARICELAHSSGLHLNLETTSGHEAEHARLSSSPRLLNETPEQLVNKRSKKTEPPEMQISPPAVTAAAICNAPRKRRQPKTRSAEASVRGGIHLIISSLETNRSFELQISLWALNLWWV